MGSVISGMSNTETFEVAGVAHRDLTTINQKETASNGELRLVSELPVD
jgi:hypothetical protein